MLSYRAPVQLTDPRSGIPEPLNFSDVRIGVELGAVGGVIVGVIAGVPLELSGMFAGGMIGSVVGALACGLAVAMVDNSDSDSPIVSRHQDEN